jgi:hypothetical protein
MQVHDAALEDDEYETTAPVTSQQQGCQARLVRGVKVAPLSPFPLVYVQFQGSFCRVLQGRATGTRATR